MTFSVVLGQDGWSVTYTKNRICVLKGSSVELSCSYTYPSGHKVTTAFWFTELGTGVEPDSLGQDPEYSGRLEYHGDKKNGQSLKITDLGESDSAEYKFRFMTNQEKGKYMGSPGVTLSVTDAVLEMVPTSVSESESVTLICRTKCTLDPIAAFIWYKNGQPIPNSNTSSPVYILFSVSNEDTGRYSCAVEGHEDLPSAEETLTVRYGPRNTSVSVSPSGEIVEGSLVTLTCSSDANPPVDKYTWYKKNIASPKASGQSYSITSISSEDRGDYYCEAMNIRGTETSIPVHINVMCKYVIISVTPPPSHLVTLIYCIMTVSFTLFSLLLCSLSISRSLQSVHHDPNSDTYTGLNVKTSSTDYDTLAVSLLLCVCV
uniref:B-cell receptor CD22 n=1 Tax=Oncorhynchus mykiss TaxID=8022 RepID=A0A8C7NP14_ONCMY